MSDNNQRPSISIVLPNYNGRKLLEKNLPSVFKAVKRYSHEIIIVDDNSSDDSVYFLEQSYPQINIIRSEQNRGFSSTCNKGINASKMDLVCIVNTDVTFTDDYFDNAVKYFTQPDMFAVKGYIINYRVNFSDVLNIEKTSLLYYKRGFLRFNQRTEPNVKDFSAKINSQFVLLGCCFVCRRDILQSLNGFDEIYSPFYWEDADLAIRSLENGYRLIYDKDCRVYHQLSSTISNYRSNNHRRLISNRNKFIFT